MYNSLILTAHCASSQAAPPFTGISRAVVAFHVHLGTFPCYGRVMGVCTRPCSAFRAPRRSSLNS